jgi:FkbM family methyltransferase
MFRKIKRTLRGFKTILFSNKEKFEFKVINGKNIKTIKGCVRIKNDMEDDMWFNKLSQHSEKIFDIGCNVGYTSLLALSNDNVKKVLMVDPNPDALGLANENVIYNNYFHKTGSFLGFVSDQNDAELEFYTIGYGDAGSIYKTHAETAAANGSSYKVQTTTIGFLADYFQWIPDFMKIDVEEAEFFVLNGAKKR